MGLAIQERRHLDQTPAGELSLAWIISVGLHLGVVAIIWLFPNPSVIAPALLYKEVFLISEPTAIAQPSPNKTEQVKSEQVERLTTQKPTPKTQPSQPAKPPIKQPDISISATPPKKKPEPPVKQQEPTALPKKTANVEHAEPIKTTDSNPTEAALQTTPNAASAPKPPTYTEARIDAKYARDNPQPQYPPMARRLGQEGTVKLKVTVNGEGYAQDVSVEQSSGYPLLDKAAVQAISKWRFVPATRDGQAITQALMTQWVYKLTDR